MTLWIHFLVMDMDAIIGGRCIGLFCQTNVHLFEYTEAFYGTPIQIWRQLASILTVSAYHFTLSHVSDLFCSESVFLSCTQRKFLFQCFAPSSNIPHPEKQYTRKSFKRYSVINILQDVSAEPIPKKRVWSWFQALFSVYSNPIQNSNTTDNHIMFIELSKNVIKHRLLFTKSILFACSSQISFALMISRCNSRILSSRSMT